MKKKSPEVSCKREVSDLYLKSGETLTVWMVQGKAGEESRTQVELRVDFDGKAEVFIADDAPVKVMPYKQWKSIYDDY